jgi:hypothetical protein
MSATPSAASPDGACADGAACEGAREGGAPRQTGADFGCYEAGFDGHWRLTEQGVVCHEIDPSSIEVNRRARRAKTDRIDLERIMRAFLAHLRGEPRACSVVHVPSVEAEDRKRHNRERERLVAERTAHTNRIKSLLHAQGIRDAMPLRPGFIASLAQIRTGDGRPLPPRLRQEIAREHERLVLVNKQLAVVPRAMPRSISWPLVRQDDYERVVPWRPRKNWHGYRSSLSRLPWRRPAGRAPSARSLRRYNALICALFGAYLGNVLKSRVPIASWPARRLRKRTLRQGRSLLA